jgi:DNA topoisomerase VI subunit B
MITDDIKGDTIIDKFTNVDEAIALNPFLEPSVSLLQPIQENVIDVTLPDVLEEQQIEAEAKKIEANKKKSFVLPNTKQKRRDNTDNKNSYFAVPKLDG